MAFCQIRLINHIACGRAGITAAIRAVCGGALRQAGVIAEDVAAVAPLPKMLLEWRQAAFDTPDIGIGRLGFVLFYDFRQGRTYVSARDHQDQMGMVRARPDGFLRYLFISGFSVRPRR